MDIIKPTFVIETNIQADDILKSLEKFGRVSYKSEDKMTTESSIIFLKNTLARGHESILEHSSITVRFICDRGVTHELVRHRLAAYTQESTRYVNYNKRQMQFIKPFFWENNNKALSIWRQCMSDCEKAYNELLLIGATPQEARSVLPNSLKTEIIVTANIREWRHILKLRTAKNAHPQMREIMIPLLEEFKIRIPILFDDICYLDTVPIIITKNVVDWRYISGFFDGEGSISISKHGVKISFWQSSLPVLNNIREFLVTNGITPHLTERIRKHSSGVGFYKTAYGLHVSCKGSDTILLKSMLPFCIVKKEKILEALNFINTLRHSFTRLFNDDELKIVTDLTLSSRSVAIKIGCSNKKVLGYRKSHCLEK